MSEERLVVSTQTHCVSSLLLQYDKTLVGIV
jgi:hypothetical protein